MFSSLTFIVNRALRAFVRRAILLLAGLLFLAASLSAASLSLFLGLIELGLAPWTASALSFVLFVLLSAGSFALALRRMTIIPPKEKKRASALAHSDAYRVGRAMGRRAR